MQHWLMKSEPEAFSIDMLQKLNKGVWDGVRNYQVRNMMRDDMSVGDMALFYHSNAGALTGVAGVMKIISSAYPDPTQFDAKSEYYDAKSTKENPRWLCVDVEYIEKLPRLVTLQEIRANPVFKSFRLIEQGTRLSILPTSKKHFDAVIVLGKNL